MTEHGHRHGHRWRSGLAAAAALIAGAFGAEGAVAAPGHRAVLVIDGPVEDVAMRPITIGLGKSSMIELQQDVRDVVVSSPEVIEAVVRTPRQIYLIGQRIGQANAFLIGRDGRRIALLDITVERDLAPIAAMIARLIPDSTVRLDAVNDNVVLTGSVRNPADAARAADIAARFVAGRERVVNLLTVEAREQVLLKVSVVEMNRAAVRRLGVDVTEMLAAVGPVAFTAATESGFPLSAVTVAKAGRDPTTAAPTVPAGGAVAVRWSAGDGHGEAMLQALERAGLARTLAEPNLTAISGETANFLAGGEFPVPVSGNQDAVTVAFKPFGVGLAFTPVVLSEGRISLKVSTEVSELTAAGAVTAGGITIPALSLRRASTTIELPSGGALVMAGLIAEETRRHGEGVPGLKHLPVLGALFRSEDFIRSQTELVVIVTPYLVRPVAGARLARPDHDATAAGDADDDFGFIVE